MVRSVESTALSILRAIESEGLKGLSVEILVTVPSGVDLYLLNQKRATLTETENRYQLNVTINRDEDLVNPDFRIQTLAERKEPLTHVVMAIKEEIIEDIEEEDQPEPPSIETTAETETSSTGERKRRRNRRRQRKPASQRSPIEAVGDATPSQNLGASEAPPQPIPSEEAAATGERTAKHSRRRRRFGKRPRHRSPHASVQEASETMTSSAQSHAPVPLRPEPAENTGTRKGWWKRLLES
jgi:ribonuclease E